MIIDEIKDELIDEVPAAAEVVVETPAPVAEVHQAIKFSNGSEFSSEELSAMTPDTRAKIVLQKEQEVAFQKGLEEKAKARKEAEASTPKDVATTPGIKSDMEKQWASDKTKQNFVTAYQAAKSQYGDAQGEMIAKHIESVVKPKLDEGDYKFNFAQEFISGHAVLLTSDIEYAKGYTQKLHGADLSAAKDIAAKKAKLFEAAGSRSVPAAEGDNPLSPLSEEPTVTLANAKDLLMADADKLK